MQFMNRAHEWFTPCLAVRTMMISGISGLILSLLGLWTIITIVSEPLPYRVQVDWHNNDGIFPTYVLFLEKIHPDPNKKPFLR